MNDILTTTAAWKNKMVSRNEPQSYEDWAHWMTQVARGLRRYLVPFCSKYDKDIQPGCSELCSRSGLQSASVKQDKLEQPNHKVLWLHCLKQKNNPVAPFSAKCVTKATTKKIHTKKTQNASTNLRGQAETGKLFKSQGRPYCTHQSLWVFASLGFACLFFNHWSGLPV